MATTGEAGATDRRQAASPVLPLVLYNGEQEWPYPTELAALCHPPPKDLRSFQPQDYLLIDESRYEEEQLAGQRNLVATLMRLEHARDVQSLQAIIEELLTWLRLDDQTALRRNLAQWIVRLIRRRVPRGEVPELTDLLEVNTMLAKRDIDWGAKWKQQGREEGREEGQAALLLRQLSKRFGPLPSGLCNGWPAPGGSGSVNGLRRSSMRRTWESCWGRLTTGHRCRPAGLATMAGDYTMHGKQPKTALEGWTKERDSRCFSSSFAASSAFIEVPCR
nr:Rpn family recombination-promoting nuclease/putative transposase [Stutzerimonas kirkiae]